MIKSILAMLLIAQGNYLNAQHVQYSDKKKPVITKLKGPATDSVVYHQWPDKCPAISGSIPVLTNYVPREMVQKLTEYMRDIFIPLRAWWPPEVSFVINCRSA
jgi:hypothetical protein